MGLLALVVHSFWFTRISTFCPQISVLWCTRGSLLPGGVFWGTGGGQPQSRTTRQLYVQGGFWGWRNVYLPCLRVGLWYQPASYKSARVCFVRVRRKVDGSCEVSEMIPMKVKCGTLVRLCALCALIWCSHQLNGVAIYYPGFTDEGLMAQGDEIMCPSHQ